MSTPWIGHSLKISVEFDGIDTKALESKTEEAAIDGMGKFRDEIEKKWRERVKATLDKTEAEYLKGLTVTHSGLEVEVKLTGKMPVGIEEGFARFDMKPGILKNRASRVIPMGSPTSPKFRTMKADSTGWWHPGTQGRAIHRQVERDVPQMVDKVFKPLLTRMAI